MLFFFNFLPNIRGPENLYFTNSTYISLKNCFKSYYFLRKCWISHHFARVDFLSFGVLSLTFRIRVAFEVPLHLLIIFMCDTREAVRSKNI